MQFSSKTYLWLTVLHLAVGFFGAHNSSIITLAYLSSFVLFVILIIKSRDANGRAGFFVLYLMGFEVIYRMGGNLISWELGKYLSILVFLTGLLLRKRQKFPYAFLILLVLLIPAIFLTHSDEPGRAREMVVFNMSGPLTLVLSGMYFYGRKLKTMNFFNGLRLAFLPAFSFIVLISLRSAISSLEFTSIQSNPGAAGGFAANQVSTLFGWFTMLVILFKVFGRRITPFAWLDWVMLGMLFLRGLLTFSRGGILSMVFALFAGLAGWWLNDQAFRNRIKQYFPRIAGGLVVLFMVIVYANHLTNNYLLYRYQGKTTTEVQTGRSSDERDLLTGRGEIMKGDIAAFKAFPMLGVGYGMAVKWHAIFFGHYAAAHTEYSRLLSEHGMLGMIFMILAFVILPVKHYMYLKSGAMKFVFLSFLLISLFTMFHAAMRIALPGVLYGASFVLPNLRDSRESV